MITKFNFKDKTIKSYAIRKLTPIEKTLSPASLPLSR